MRKLLLLASILFGVSVSQAAPTSFVQIRETLQSGATFYVSSGTVSGPLYVSTIAFTSTSSGGILGTKTNDDSCVGCIGEYSASNVATATNAPATGVWGDLTSISLAAGDWDLSAFGNANVAIANQVGEMDLGISSTTGNSSAGLVDGYSLSIASGTLTLMQISLSVPSLRIKNSSSFTAYLKYKAVYPGSTPQYRGSIRARRIR